MEDENGQSADYNMIDNDGNPLAGICHARGVNLGLPPVWLTKKVRITENWLPEKKPLNIVLTAGASCPDVLLDEVMRKVSAWYPGAITEEEVLGSLKVGESERL